MRNWTWGFLAACAPAALIAPAAAQTTLPEALTAAYANNPTLAGARAGSQAAEERFVQARAGLVPRIGLSGSIGTREIDSVTEVPGAPNIVTSSEIEPSAYGVTVTQPLYQGGRLRALTRQAGAGARAAEERLRSIEQQVLLQAIARYVDVRRDEELVRIRTNNVEVLSRQLQAARDRFEVGEITRTDVAQAEARFSGAEASLAAGRAGLEASRANFAAVIGSSPGVLAPPPPAAQRPASLEVALEAGLEANPDLRAAREGEVAAKAAVTSAAAGLKPSLAVVGSAQRQFDQQVIGREDEVVSATAQLSIPLFEGGLQQSRLREARLALREAEADVDETRRAVVARVTSAWNDLAAADLVIAASREQSRAAALALEGAEEELKVGLRTTLDVLNTQQDALNAQLAIANAERDAYVAAHALLAAIGGLEPQSLGVTAPLYDAKDIRRRVRTTIIGFAPQDAQ
jgi:outer membrane protein